MVIPNDRLSLFHIARETSDSFDWGRPPALARCSGPSAVTSFANGTLVEVSRLIMDLRQSSQSLTRLLNSIEDNPVELLMGKPRREYSPANN